MVGNGWYFAYGANMHDSVLTRRGVRSLNAMPGVLEGYKRTLQMPGIRFAEPRFATLIESSRSRVHGVVHEMTGDDLLLLDRYELNQERFEVQIQSAETTVSATAYRSRLLVEPGPCSRRYKRLMIEGARDHGLPEEAIAELTLIPVGGVPGLDRTIGPMLRLLEAAERSNTPLRWLHRLLERREP